MKTLYFQPKTPVQQSNFQISKVQPETLNMEQSPLDGVFQEMRTGENNRKNDFNNFSGMTNRLVSLMDSADKEMKIMKKEHVSFKREIGDLVLWFNKKIDSIKIPKSQDKEIKDLFKKMSEISDDIKSIKETKKEDVGGVGSKISVRRNMGKVFVDEIPRGTIDGVNKDFYLARPPFAGVLFLELNMGAPQKDEDYTLTANKISYTTAPPEGSKHRAKYF